MSVQNHAANVLSYFKPLGHPLKKVYFGVELEICVDADGGPRNPYKRRDVGSWEDPAQRIVQDLEEAIEGFGILKTDGSIADSGTGGVEIVTVPASLAVHKKRWEELMKSNEWVEELVPLASCGMHVHFTKAPLTPEQRWRVHYFISRPENRQFITKIAGRVAAKYCMPIVKTIGNVEIGTNTGRYEAVNALGPATIEVRIFASTREYVTLITRLEFVAALVHWVMSTKNLSESTLIPESLHAFVKAHSKRYKEFLTWLEAK